MPVHKGEKTQGVKIVREMQKMTVFQRDEAWSRDYDRFELASNRFGQEINQEIWLDENWKIFGFAGWLALAGTERFQMGWF